MISWFSFWSFGPSVGWLDPASRCRLRMPSSVINLPYFSEDAPGCFSGQQTECYGSGSAGTGIGGARHWC